MKLRMFTFQYDRAAGQFDDAPLQNLFASGAEAIEVRDHFFECDGQPVWAVLVSYRDGSDSRPMGLRQHHEAKKDLKQELSIDEALRFDALRTWRNTRATREGKPPYVLLTNRQLAAIAKRNPTTLTGLGEIAGIGASKLSDFGAELLAILAAAQATTSQTAYQQELHADQ